MNAENPYAVTGDYFPPPPKANPPRFDTFTLLAWPLLFAVNAVVPAIFGSILMPEHGRLGSLLAGLGLLVISWAFCIYYPYVARRVALGAIVTALSQLFPIIHTIIGMFALGIAKNFGALENGDRELIGPPIKISSEFGGALVTMLVGGGVLGVAAAIGFLFSLLLPARWFSPRTPQAQSEVESSRGLTGNLLSRP